jgi:putative flavoprotein involved in K+ transport
MPQTVEFIQGYAEHINAPVRTQTPVTRVARTGESGYTVETGDGSWQCQSVVLASGACNIPVVPQLAASLPRTIETFTPFDYRSPQQLNSGSVLVVGASATGTQIAEEIQASGRQVTVAVGEHVRAPRTYRGRDIQWWLDQAGILDETYLDIDDINRARSLPSFQLAGSTIPRNVDLNTLTAKGVRMIGRLAGIDGSRGQFSGSLRNLCKLADLKMNRLLNTIDEWASENEGDVAVEPSHRFEATRVEDSPPLTLDFVKEDIRTIIWATGFRPDYSYLDVPVFNQKGRIRHDGGIVESPGLYLMGMPFLRRRKSTLIDGAGQDASDLSEHLAGYLNSV